MRWDSVEASPTALSVPTAEGMTGFRVGGVSDGGYLSGSAVFRDAPLAGTVTSSDFSRPVRFAPGADVGELLTNRVSYRVDDNGWASAWFVGVSPYSGGAGGGINDDGTIAGWSESVFIRGTPSGEWGSDGYGEEQGWLWFDDDAPVAVPSGYTTYGGLINNRGDLVYTGPEPSPYWTTLLVARDTFNGEYNGDGVVDQGDLDLVLQNWGSYAPVEWRLSRPNDSKIDQAELDGVLQNWGSTASPDFRGIDLGSSSPEPAAGTVLVLTLGALRRPRH